MACDEGHVDNVTVKRQFYAWDIIFMSVKCWSHKINLYYIKLMFITL